MPHGGGASRGGPPRVGAPGAGLSQAGTPWAGPPGGGDPWAGPPRVGPPGGGARLPHLLRRPAEWRLGTRGKGGPEFVHGGCRGAGPLRRQGALWRRRAAVRLGSLGAPPSARALPPHQHCPGVGSAGRCQTCRPPPLGAVAAPGPGASHPAGPGCPWTGRGHGTGQGRGFTGEPILAPRTLTLPLFRSVLFLLRGPTNLAASRRSPSPALPWAPTLLRPRPAFSPLSLSLTLSGGARSRSSGRRKGGFRRAASGSRGGSTTYLRQGRGSVARAAPLECAPRGGPARREQIGRAESLTGAPEGCTARAPRSRSSRG